MLVCIIVWLPLVGQRSESTLWPKGQIWLKAARDAFLHQAQILYFSTNSSCVWFACGECKYSGMVVGELLGVVSYFVMSTVNFGSLKVYIAGKLLG